MKVLPSLLAAAALVTALAGPVRAQMGAGARTPPPGSQFPEITLPDVTGKLVSLSDFKGKAILLSFWSCHTDTCFTSVRVIEDLLKEYAPRGLVAPTICSEIPPALEKDGYAGLMKQCGTGQVLLIDKDMVQTRKLGLGPSQLPTTFLIDRNHAVWQVIEGIRPLMTEDFRVLVKSLVTE